MQVFSAVAGILLLGFAAEKCRELGWGDEHPWRNGGERFTFTDCFDMGVGSAACVVKEILKLYLYYIRAMYVQEVRAEAAQKALAANLSVEAAREEGEAAARRAKRHVRHVMGPVLSAGWDLFETLYVGGTAGRGLFGPPGRWPALTAEGSPEKGGWGGWASSGAARWGAGQEAGLA